MGGEVTVQSEPGQGTLFSIFVPLERDEASTAPSSALSGKRIAIVGFDAECARDAEELVEALGGIAHSAADFGGAQEADIVLADERCAVSSLNDESLPDLSGRLVVATRFGGSSRSRLERVGAFAFIPMPVRADRLVCAVESLLAGAGAGPRAEGARPAIALGDGRDGILALRRYADILERAQEIGDFGAAERDSKRYRELFSELGLEEGERLAFSALLLSRKSDGRGLRELPGRIRDLAKECDGLVDGKTEAL
jgi:hypothetical protein